MTLYMPLFRCCTALRQLTQVHAHLVVTGLHHQPPAATKLIETYSQMGSLRSSDLAFSAFQDPDSFMWGVLIKCHVRCLSFRGAISLYRGMMASGGARAGSFVFPPVLKACGGFGDLGVGGEVHGRIVKMGFCCDEVIETSLADMYGELGCLGDARKVFDDMPARDLVSWSSLVSRCVDNGEMRQGLDLFRSMVLEGFELDSLSFTGVVDACGELGCLKLGRSIHGYILRNCVKTCMSLNTSMVAMYSKCSDLLSAERIFGTVEERSVSTWTAMISSYDRSGLYKEALYLFLEMLALGLEPNVVAMMGVIGSCTGLGWLRGGKSVHCFVLKRDTELQVDRLGPILIELYAECGKVGYCGNVLCSIGEGDIVAWNMLISIYVRKGLPKEALLLFQKMQKQGLMPDSYGLSSSLSACGDAGFLHLGQQMHGHVLKRHILTEFVQNSLMDMYSKCRLVDLAYSIFNDISPKSVSTWNCMICGFSQNGFSSGSIKLLRQMYLGGLEMNEVTFLGAIQACSNMGHIENGKWLHHKLITCGAGKDVQIETALVDMYSKCGDLQTAQRVFDSMFERTVVSWSTLIAGYGMHGRIDDAISTFDQMMQSGIMPNEVTFTNILSACSHAGCVEAGKFYFGHMRDLGVEPDLEHSACMVDLLSRAGDLSGAYEMIKSMPFPVHSNIWASLLNGCRIHHQMDMVRSIEKELFHMNVDDHGCHTLLSNIYAEEGNWSEFKKVRTVVKERGLKRVPGYSSVIDKKACSFVAADMSPRRNLLSLDKSPRQGVKIGRSSYGYCTLPAAIYNTQEQKVAYVKKCHLCIAQNPFPELSKSSKHKPKSKQIDLSTVCPKPR